MSKYDIQNRIPQKTVCIRIDLEPAQLVDGAAQILYMIIAATHKEDLIKIS